MGQRASATPPDRWQRRQLAGFAVRFLVVAVPFFTALLTIVLLGRVVPTTGRLGGATRYALIFGVSWLVMALTHRALHRLIPLAALLEMSLLFPERAPSRLKLARRVASGRDLEDLRSGRTNSPDESTQEAAERILALVSALSEHDRGTRGHSERVRVLTDLIAERIGLSPQDRDRLRWSALLHDIGKLAVPVEVLNKPGKPSDHEWEVLRRHPVHGERIAAPLLGWLGEWGDVIVQHHEKFDGTGYPTGRSGHRICLGARIVTVADAYDVMTAARAYKKPMGRAAALRELVACSGKHFDPDVVRALISVPQRRMLLAMGPISWLTGLPFVGQAPTAVSATLTSQAGVAVGAVALTGTAAFTPIAGTGRPVVHHEPGGAGISVTSSVRPAATGDPTGAHVASPGSTGTISPTGSPSLSPLTFAGEASPSGGGPLGTESPVSAVGGSTGTAPTDTARTVGGSGGGSGATTTAGGPALTSAPAPGTTSAPKNSQKPKGPKGTTGGATPPGATRGNGGGNGNSGGNSGGGGDGNGGGNGGNSGGNGNDNGGNNGKGQGNASAATQGTEAGGAASGPAQGNGNGDANGGGGGGGGGGNGNSGGGGNGNGGGNGGNGGGGGNGNSGGNGNGKSGR